MIMACLPVVHFHALFFMNCTTKGELASSLLRVLTQKTEPDSKTESDSKTEPDSKTESDSKKNWPMRRKNYAMIEQRIQFFFNSTKEARWP